MNSIITDNLDKIKALCQQHRVKSLYLFGSAGSDLFNDSSDIDLLVDFDQMDFGDYADNYFATAEALEHVFERPVDLVTAKSLSNPFLINAINQTKTLLYEKREVKAFS